MKHVVTALFLCGALLLNSAFAQSVPPFDPSPLFKNGDNVPYGSYVICKIGDGVYKLNDPGTTTGSGGAWGVDMYLVCGEKMALMIDTGSDYIYGKEGNGILPRENAAEELLAVVDGLAGALPLEIAFTHGHGDHTGMTSAFVDRNVTIWQAVGPPEPEDRVRQPKPADRQKTSEAESEPSAEIDYTPFTPGEKTFDLGGGRVVETFLVRGHSNNGTVYILKKDLLLFTGDAMGSGFGQAFKNVAPLRDFAEDIQNFVVHISAELTPYERYALKVYTGHTWQNVYNGYYSPDMEKVDMGYLDWRFVQNVASCAKGIIEGKWLVEGSGLIHAANMPKAAFWLKTEGQAIMVYGLGAIVMPIELAYEAAGLKMPE